MCSRHEKKKNGDSHKKITHQQQHGIRVGRTNEPGARPFHIYLLPSLSHSSTSFVYNYTRDELSCARSRFLIGGGVSCFFVAQIQACFLAKFLIFRRKPELQFILKFIITFTYFF